MFLHCQKQWVGDDLRGAVEKGSRPSRSGLSCPRGRQTRPDKIPQMTKPPALQGVLKASDRARTDDLIFTNSEARETQLQTAQRRTQNDRGRQGVLCRPLA